MKTKHTRLIGFALVGALAGCAIQQNVKPVGRFEGKEVCVIENAAVKYNFLTAFRKSLEGRGYTVKMLPPMAALRDCPVTATYTANWRWDLAMYMAYAEIKVFNNGQPAGEAVYNSLGGGANMSKFIEAETKINELVNQLFPG
jgi:hypothetical protein